MTIRLNFIKIDCTYLHRLEVLSHVCYQIHDVSLHIHVYCTIPYRLIYPHIFPLASTYQYILSFLYRFFSLIIFFLYDHSLSSEHEIKSETSSSGRYCPTHSHSESSTFIYHADVLLYSSEE